MTETPAAVHPDIAHVLLGADQIRARVAELGRQITRDYAGKEPLLVGVLRGGALFLSDLLRHIDLPCEIDFVCLSSYNGRSSSGVAQLLLDLRESAEDRDLILVEDIVDTGLTLSYLFQNLKTRHPRSVEVCVLLDKPECRKVKVAVKYVGFNIPNEFVVGYGLDYNEKYRNLPYIGALRPPALIHDRA